MNLPQTASLDDHRDGVSQAERLSAALQPDYVAVDERSLKDLLAFAQAYAKELRYFPHQNNTELKAQGDWRDFLGEDLDLDQVLAFIETPENFPPQQYPQYYRPHFLLFLTYLQLLRLVQADLNKLTRRHLDFYYQAVLHLTKKAAIPDQVHVLVQLANDIASFELPADTLLDAGTDSAGGDLVYRTECVPDPCGTGYVAMVFNQAQIAQLSSIYVDKQVIGLREAREGHEGSIDEAFMALLNLALGDPAPDDPLPPYPPDDLVDYDFLLAGQEMINFVSTDLCLDFYEFRDLLKYKQQRDQSDPEWDEINSLLEKAGQTRTDDPNYQLNPTNRRDFETNLNTAMGGPPNYDTLPEVDDIYDLYDQRARQDVQDFIQTALYFDDLNDFNRLMQLKVRIDGEWDEINRLLEEAGQRKGVLDPAAKTPYVFPVAEPKEAGAFETNFAAALGSDVYDALTASHNISTLDQHYAAFLGVEAYFFMSAENFSYMLGVQTKTDPTLQEWDKVYAILAEAHRQKVYAQRQAALKEVREAAGFEAMTDFAVGPENTQSDLTSLQILGQYLEPEEVAFLEDIQAREDTGKVTEAEWADSYRLVEKAQRSILPPPVAQKEAWGNLYPWEDATAATIERRTSFPGGEAGTRFATETNLPRWKTFGQSQPVVQPGSPPPSSIGWAISSPLLALNQGQRTITLTLGFGPDEFQTETLQNLFSSDEPSPLQIELSTEKGWLEAEQVAVSIGDYASLSGLSLAEQAGESADSLAALQFTLTFAEDVVPIRAPPAEETHLQSEWPILRVMLCQVWQADPDDATRGRYISHYQSFKDLQLFRVQVKVAVSGLNPTQIQNDERALKAGSPFEPFGSTPLVGSRFYLGHPELICKKLDCLDCQIVWMNVPPDLQSGYYQHYAELSSNPDFTARLSLIDGPLDLTLLPAAPLFDPTNVSNPGLTSIPDVSTAIETHQAGYHYQRASAIETEDDLLAWNRYLQWELNLPDFQHSHYSTLVSQKSLELSVALAQESPGSVDDYHVNPPYTPKIKAISLSYTAAIEINVAAYQAGGMMDHLFHIHPFGYSEFTGPPPSGSQPFLPQYQDQGELYLGLRDVQAPQSLSLLCQMSEGSANPDVTLRPVKWHYLSGNVWHSLADGQLLQDGTRGLINSGIILFSLPPVQPSTLLRPDLYWLRASIAQNSDSVCDTVAMHTQAVSAIFVDQDNAADHLSQPLPAESINDLVERQAEVAAIEQPYTSFKGKAAEADESFYTRVSERLRHKNRALTVWDYEHLVLEAFPQIYKAKCLPSTPENLGQVDLIVIPDIKNRFPFNPFEPKVSADQIADIETFLSDKMPPFATLQVKNAFYATVKVRFGVRFRSDANSGYDMQRLNEDLNRFLSPWAYEAGAEIVIGGRIYANVLINFLEERPYVDYVAQIKLFRSDDGHNFSLILPDPDEGYWVSSDRPDGVLVAAPEHEIDLITDAGYNEEDFIGINYMKIELDFIVG